MAGDIPDRRQDLAESSATFPSDSENYSSGNNDLSPSPPSSSSSPMILYSPPTIWGLLRGAAINLLLPFVNGLMLGFGELFAHEAAFRLGWSGTKVQPAPYNSHESLDYESLWLSTFPSYSKHRLGDYPALTELTLLRSGQVFPSGRTSRPVGPGIEMRDGPVKNARPDDELEYMTALE